MISDFVNYQKEAKNRLFLNLFQMSNADLNQLFASCKNIATLDLVLGHNNLILSDFSCLQNLNNLRNLLIHFHSFEDPYPTLFENLTLYAQTRQTLQEVNLQFFEGSISKGFSSVIDFFKACQNTLNKVFLHFYKVKASVPDLKLIYKELVNLKELRSCSLIFNDFNDNKLSDSLIHYHTSFLSDLLKRHASLEEIYLDMPRASIKNNTKLDFQNNKALTRLTLDMDIGNISALINTQELTNLVFLKLNISKLKDDEWKKFFHMMRKFKALEVLYLNCRVSFESDEGQSIKEGFNMLLKDLPSLKVIICNRTLAGAKIFRKSSFSLIDVADFLKSNSFPAIDIEPDKISFY